jgi:ribosomal protein S27AE
MRCLACGLENPPTNRFCSSCGGMLAQMRPSTPQAQTSERIHCGHCGLVVPTGGRFCVQCGQPVTAGGPAVVNPSFPASVSSPPLQSIPESISAVIAEGKKLGSQKLRAFALSGGVLLIYVLLTRNLTPLLVTIGVAFVMRRFSEQIDSLLNPLWPYREGLPRGYRPILAWVVPVVVAFLITASPSVFNMFAWLPLIGPDASVFTFTTVISAFFAYFLMREPKR